MKKRHTVFTTIVLLLAGFGLLPAVQAVNPPPDGYYGNGNTAEGFDALYVLTTGQDNTALGELALYRNTTGAGNTATGSATLLSNTTGNYNTATGVLALYDNTTGSYNTAHGYQALYNNLSNRNTATGAFALFANTNGTFNTADGYATLNHNTTGYYNTANGYGALYSNITGLANTAMGAGTLFISTADGNSAFGSAALLLNSTGADNTGLGKNALLINTTGSNNIALGNAAGSNLTTGGNNIDIGNAGAAAESGTIRIGTGGTQTAAYVAGIFGATVTDAAPVLVGADGHLGTAVSSARFKEEIKPMSKASEAVFSLKPVTFRYRKELDPVGRSQFGLVAEDVEKIDRDLVVHDTTGNPYSVRYDAVNAMLLNEFLKEHRKVQKLEAALEAVNKRLKAQDEKIQKLVSRIDPDKPATQTALNNP